ncbi:MAG: hypothetical protein U9N73_11895 [Candidatus Auribacterota bacterium]|nr:hypothetical protein [Candidatus Auribacterota bacterium]
MLKLYRAIIQVKLKSAEIRELANRLDEKWLSGDRDLLIQIAEKDPKIKELLGSEIVIADLVSKSKLTINYTNLSRAKFKKYISPCSSINKNPPQTKALTMSKPVLNSVLASRTSLQIMP